MKFKLNLDERVVAAKTPGHFGLGLGITEERSIELLKAMKKMAFKMAEEAGNLDGLSTHHLAQNLSELAETPEELFTIGVIMGEFMEFRRGPVNQVLESMIKDELATIGGLTKDPRPHND